MAIKEGMRRQISDFFYDGEIDGDWLRDHVSVECDDKTKTVTIKIDDVSEQEFEWFKEEM